MDIVIMGTIVNIKNKLLLLLNRHRQASVDMLRVNCIIIIMEAGALEVIAVIIITNTDHTMLIAWEDPVADLDDIAIIIMEVRRSKVTIIA